MSRQDRADRDGPLPHGRLPVVLAGGQFDLAEDRVDHAVEEVVFVGDVVVERHRGAAELLAELAHAEGLDAVSVGEVDGGAQDTLSGQGGRGSARGPGCWAIHRLLVSRLEHNVNRQHLAERTPYV